MAEALSIRPAGAGEAEAIRRLVRAQPRMNPTGLEWRRFLVAVEPGGGVVGCVQLRPAGPGAVELGSLVVAPPHRGRGLAGVLTSAVLARTGDRVLVVTAAAHAGRYAPWGFRRIELRAAPWRVALHCLVGQAASGLRLLQGYRPRRIVVLERPAASPC